MRTLFFLCFLSFSLQAQIITDNSFGNRQSLSLSQQNYDIHSDLGKVVGDNLFHSFEEFNIYQDETATFSGDANIKNVISRVTGNEPSQIDGVLRNTIPNANTYLTNPNGVMFGEHAKLDVQGSFHASTAHYLKFADGKQLYTRDEGNNIFSAAAVTAFGFLDQNVASIQYQGGGMQLETGWEGDVATLQGLTVPEGKSLSLIGGDIELRDGIFFQTSPRYAEEYTFINSIAAPGGQVNLVATAGKGEIKVGEGFVDTTEMAKLGTVRIEQQASVGVSGAGAGRIFIRAGDVIIDDGVLEANTYGDRDSGIIDVHARHDLNLFGGQINVNSSNGKGSNASVILQADETLSFSVSEDNFLKESQINSVRETTSETNNTITLRAKTLIARNETASYKSTISFETENTQQVPAIVIEAQELIDFQKLRIHSYNARLELSAPKIVLDKVYFTGSMKQGGNHIDLNATDYIQMTGTDIRSNVDENNIEKGGQITLHAPIIELLEGSQIITSTNNQTSNAGDIYIQADANLRIEGVSLDSEAESYSSGIASKINSSARADSSYRTVHVGNAGKIIINAGSLSIIDGGLITSSTIVTQQANSQVAHTTGQGGDIHIQVDGPVVIKGVNIYGQTLDGFASAISSSSTGQGAGKAGNIVLQAASLTLEDGAQIKSNTDNTSAGGDIHLEIQGDTIITGDTSNLELLGPLYQQNIATSSQDILPSNYNQATSGIYADSTGKTTQSGEAGSINLTTNNLDLSNRAQISTTSYGGGNSGTIQIQAQRIQVSDDAIITSANQAGNRSTFANQEARDAVLIIGDLIEVKDSGNATLSDENEEYAPGRSELYVYTNDGTLRLNPVYEVENMDELYSLNARYRFRDDLAIVTVRDAGDGQSAQFLYTKPLIFQDDTMWTRLDSDASLVFDTMEDFKASAIGHNYDQVWFTINAEQALPPATSALIYIKDAGEGKALNLIYKGGISAEYPDYFYRQIVEQTYFTVSDNQELATLAQQTQLPDLSLVDVLSDDSLYVYYNEQWLPLSERKHQVADTSALSALPQLSVGHVVELADDSGDAIFTGYDWLPVNRVLRVDSLEERDLIQAQPGDWVKILNSETGYHDGYVYFDGEWHAHIRGGKAGNIDIQTTELTLKDGGKITTESKSSGGGLLKIHNEGLMLMENAEISSSVEEGIGGGGDINIDTEFLIQDHTPIIARAFEGAGGNIQITSKGIYQFQPKDTSPIDASSELGQSGEVKLNLPDNLDSSIVVLQGKLFDMSNQIINCDANNHENFSKFTVDFERDGILDTAVSLD